MTLRIQKRFYLYKLCKGPKCDKYLHEQHGYITRNVGVELQVLA